jgi:hypothetical protein
MIALLVLPAAFGAEDFRGHTFYFGDLHAHTGVSPDASAMEYGNCKSPVVCGAMDELFETARANALDFVALTDHTTSSESEFNDLLDRIRDENSSTLVTIPAIELSHRSTTKMYGHKNLYVFQDDDTKLEDLDFDSLKANIGIKTDCAVDIWMNAAYLSNTIGPSLLVSHHPTAQAVMTTDWSCHHGGYEPVVEVYSGWGNALTDRPDYDPPDLTSDYTRQDASASSATIDQALESFDMTVGFIAGTDLHDTRPGMTCDTATGGHGAHAYGGGLTMVVLDDSAPLKRSSIYGELVARRTLATTGPRMPVLVEWTTDDGTVHSIGEQLRVPNSATKTTVTVRVPAAWQGYVTGVEAIGHTAELALTETSPGKWELPITNSSIPGWLYVAVEIDGEALYGAGVCEDGGDDDREFVWSSPTWFYRSAIPAPIADADGDGYDEVLDCDDSDDSVHPWATEVIRDDVDQDCNGYDKKS